MRVNKFDKITVSLLVFITIMLTLSLLFSTFPINILVVVWAIGYGIVVLFGKRKEKT